MDWLLAVYVGALAFFAISGVFYWLDKIEDYQRRIATIAQGRKEW